MSAFKVGDLVQIIPGASHQYTITTENLIMCVEDVDHREQIKVSFVGLIPGYVFTPDQICDQFITMDHTYWIAQKHCQIYSAPAKNPKTKEVTKIIKKLNAAVTLRKKLQKDYKDFYEITDKYGNKLDDINFIDVVYKEKEN